MDAGNMLTMRDCIVGVGKTDSMKIFKVIKNNEKNKWTHFIEFFEEYNL